MQRKSSLKSGDPDLRRSRKLKGLLLTKYDSVCEAAAALGWAVIHPDEEEAGPSEPHPSVAPRGSAPPPPQFTSDWNICWMDTSVSIERVMALGRLQKLNHFPGMLDLVRKAGTARNLNKMLKVVGKEYKFFPRTFMLPADYTELKKEFGGARRCNKTFIVKPSKGCQGTGIMLTRCLDDIDPHEPNIVQRYLHKPHLLDGRKYDLRLYVLQSSIKPLRLYLFREGLVRVCTSKYACKPSNYNELTMHLTNYAINKESDDFVQPSGIEDDEANKLTVTTLMARLAAEGADVDALWEAIGELVVKTMVSVQPHLEHTYYTARQRSDDVGYSCFELLGFDVLFDHKLRPYLLEVNHSPSFTCDSPLDSLVKASVLKGTMEMVSFGRDELKILKRCGTRLDPPTRERLCQLRNAYENARAEPSGFERIYPPSGPSAERAAELLARYDSYLDLAAELYQSQSLAGSRRTGGTQISGGGTHRRVAVPSWGPPPPAPVAAPAAAPPRAAPASAPASTTAAPSKPAASTAPPSSFAAAAAAVRRASPRRPVAAARVFAAPAAAAPYKYADGLLSRAPAPAAAPPGHMHVPTSVAAAPLPPPAAPLEKLFTQLDVPRVPLRHRPPSHATAPARTADRTARWSAPLPASGGAAVPMQLPEARRHHLTRRVDGGAGASSSAALGVGSSHALNNLAVSMAHGLTTKDRTLANDLSSRLVQQGVASLRGRT